MSSEVTAETCPQCGAPLSESTQSTCPRCGFSLIRTASTDGKGLGIRVKTVSCTDKEGTGEEVFRWAIPADWEFESDVRWHLDRPMLPATVSARAFNPQGEQAIEIFPNLSFSWSEDPLAQILFPLGSHCHGNEVRPAAPATQVLREVVIPRQREVKGLQITKEEALPELAEAVRKSSPIGSFGLSGSDGGRVRIRYRWQGHELEEEFYGVVETLRIPTRFLLWTSEQTLWLADCLFACRSAAGELDGLLAQFRAILLTLQVNPRWLYYVSYVSQYMIQNQIIHIWQTGELGRIIALAGMEMRAENLASFAARQRVTGQLGRPGLCSVYRDPFLGRSFLFPGFYRYGWAHPLHYYIFTNNPLWDPNTASEQGWRRMEAEEKPDTEAQDR